MYTNHNLATDIVDVFDDFLASKNIEIPYSELITEMKNYSDQK